MMKNKNLRLDERLSMCTRFVRPGKRVVDVGTDHAYLAIWLALNEVASHVVATDLREGPLLNAKQNIIKYEVEERIETRLQTAWMPSLPRRPKMLFWRAWAAS